MTTYILLLIGVIALVILSLVAFIYLETTRSARLDKENKKLELQKAVLSAAPPAHKPLFTHETAIKYVNEICGITFKQRFERDKILTTEVFIDDVSEYVSEMVLEVMAAIPDNIETELMYYYNPIFVQNLVIRTIKTLTLVCIEKKELSVCRKGQKIDHASQYVSRGVGVR